jgi:hypothetical protein
MKATRSVFCLLVCLSALFITFPVSSLAQTNAVRARVTDPVDMGKLVTLRGNVHPLARTEFDQGVAPDDLPLERMLLVLERGQDQEEALRQLLDNQQVKSSPQFHQWLTPEQFGQQFGPADSDIQAVTGWLASQGFQVTKVAAGRTVIEFSGSAGLARQVLGTEIHRFHVNGQDYWANVSDPQIPAALAPVVAGFASLNNFPRKAMTHRLGTFTRSKLTGEIEPLFTFPVSCGNGETGCYWFALGPADFATIYNVTPLWNAATPTDGTGVTIAIVAETNINPQDVADFRSMFGLPANAPNIILNGPDPGITDEEIEADLDVQWSGAVAKGATIDLVVSETTETTPGVDLSALYIVDNNLAPVMSASYSVCEAYLGAGGNTFHNTLWEQAAAQGITVLISAGDSGSAGCDSANEGEKAGQYGLGVSGLASTPFNVAIGGTDFNVNSSNVLSYWSLTNNSSQSSALSYIPEIPWNDSCAASGSLTGCTPPPNTTYFTDGFDLVAGSGGPSSCINPSGTFPNVSCSGNYAKPAWQSGAGVPSDGARDIPDLSLFAGDGFHGSFYVVCQMDANSASGGNSSSCDLNAPYLDFQAGSGTSASVQVFAGIMALVNQRYSRQGNANYVLYPLAAQAGASCNTSTGGSSCIFYDVTTGNNSVICQGGSPNCSSTTSGQYGIMVSNGSPAYLATTGYDLTTGLGSVNVANLVNNWKSNFTPSAVSLALSTSPATNPVTLTHGQPVNFSVNVTSGSGTPSGDVSLIAQTGNTSSNATGIGPFTLSGGSVAGSTIMLPGGSYNVTAHYAGNGTFAASDSSPGIPVTVNKESSETELRLATPGAGGIPVYNVTTVPYGSIYILRMDVTNSSGQLCAPGSGALGEQFSPTYPCPTGTVAVTPAPTDQNSPKGSVAGQYTLNSQGYAEDQYLQQVPGTYSYTASYAGDNSYKPSTSASLPVTLTKAPTTVTLSGLSSTVTRTTLYITATVGTQSSGVAPTGTVLFLDAGVPLSSSVSISGSPYSPTTGAYATAQGEYSDVLPVGPHSITVQYSGDANYAASTSPAYNVNVTDFSLSANPSTVTISAGQTATSTITVTPVNGFTGTVNLTALQTSATLTPSQVTLNGTTSATATFSWVTTAQNIRDPAAKRPPAAPVSRLPVGVHWRWLILLALGSTLPLLRWRKRVPVWPVAMLIIVAGVWVACGGGSGGSGASPVLAPAVGLQPASLNFGQVGMYAPAPTQSVTLTNTGNAPLSVFGYNFTGPAAEDYSQSANCTTQALAPGANCTISVTFRPSAAGSRNAALMINDNASDSPQGVGLSGTGTQPGTAPGNYGILVQGTSGGDTQNVVVNVTVQ